MILKLKQINRTLLELLTGILLFAVIVQLVTIFFPVSYSKFSIGFLIGVLLAILSAIHMFYSLNKAFNCDEKSAARLLSGGYVIRYLVIGLTLIALYFSNLGDPLACFLGIVGLKISAYLQPLIHKFYNAVFHETDPVAQPVIEDEHENSNEIIE